MAGHTYACTFASAWRMWLRSWCTHSWSRSQTRSSPTFGCWPARPRSAGVSARTSVALSRRSPASSSSSAVIGRRQSPRARATSVWSHPCSAGRSALSRMRMRPAKPRRSASMRWPTTSLAHHSPAAGCHATTRSGSAPSSARKMVIAASRHAATSEGVRMSASASMVVVGSDVGDDRRRLFIKRALQRGGELGVVLVGHRKDPALRDLARQVLEQLRQRLLRYPFGERIVDVDLPVAHLQRIQRARVLLRHVDAEVEVAKRGGQERLDPAYDLVGIEKALPLAHLELIQDLFARHPPLQLAIEDVPPLGAEALLVLCALIAVGRVVPPPDLFEQRPLGEVQIGMQRLTQVESERDLHRLVEDLLEMQVDPARRPVVVDVGVHVEARVQEHDERLKPAAVEREALLREERVIDDALDVDRAHRDSAHVGVAQHVIHVVGGEDAREQRLEELEPLRVMRQRLGIGLAHQVADPLGIDRLVGVERAARAAAQRSQDVAELLADDALADQLMGQAVVDEEVVVEEVTEGAVTDVVQQTGHAQELFEQRGRGRLAFEDRAKRRIELLRQPSRQMHGPQRVLKAAVLGRGEHPARGLKLWNAPEPLGPRRVDDVLLGRLARNATGPRIEDVLMDRIRDEPAALVRVGGAFHTSEGTALSAAWNGRACSGPSSARK